MAAAEPGGVGGGGGVGGCRVNVSTPSWLTATTLTAASSAAATVSELKTLGRANIFPVHPPARAHNPKQMHASIHQRSAGVRKKKKKKEKKSDHLLPCDVLQVEGGHQASAGEGEVEVGNSGNI